MNIGTYKDLDVEKAIDVLTGEIPDSRPAHYLLVREKAKHVICQMAYMGLSPFLMEMHNTGDVEAKSNCVWINTNFRSPCGHLANVLLFCCQDDTFLGIINGKAVPSGYKNTTDMTDSDLVQYIATVNPYCYGDSYSSAPLRYYMGMSSAPWLQAMCYTHDSSVFKESVCRLIRFFNASFDSSLDKKKRVFSAISVTHGPDILGIKPSWFVVGYTRIAFIRPGNMMWVAPDQLFSDAHATRRYILETRSAVPIYPARDGSDSVMVLASPRQIMVRLDSDTYEYTYAINPYMVNGWNLNELEQDPQARDLIIRIVRENLQREAWQSLYARTSNQENSW